MLGTYIHHSMLVSPAASKEVVDLVNAGIPLCFILKVCDGLGNSLDDKVKELARQDEVLFSPVKVPPRLLESESDK